VNDIHCMRALESCREQQAKNKELQGERIRLVVPRPVIGELCEKNPLKDEVCMCTEILTSGQHPDANESRSTHPAAENECYNWKRWHIQCNRRRTTESDKICRGEEILTLQ
jgi:hypothetical protein